MLTKPSAPSGSCPSSSSVTPTVCPASPFSIKTAENISASSLLGRVAQGALNLQVLVERVLAPLPAVAAALVAAERRSQVKGMVDRHPSRADPAGHRAGLVDVDSRHITRQAVVGVVGDLDGLVDVVVAEDAEHRAEDLLARNLHVVFDVGEDRRLDVVPRVQTRRPAGTAGDDRGTRVDAALDQALDPVD